MTLSSTLSIPPSRRILHHGIIIIIIFTINLLMARPISAGDPTSPPPGPGTDPYGKSFNPSMGVVIIVLIAALFFMGFFSIYIRHCSEDINPTTGRNRAVMGSVARSRRVQLGLDRDVIESFPTFDYASVKSLKIGKGALECAVCITEFEDDDTLRLIPKCDHVFHPECIDAWLVGNTTCPVCRSSLVPEPGLGSRVGSIHEPASNPDLHDQNDDVTVEVDDVEERETESMEQPLSGSINRSRTMRRNLSLVGRPRWLGKMRFARSFSTGHVAVKQWENMERFTLRLPDEVRKQVMSGKLERTTSLVVLPRETSSRRGYRTGFGDEGSSRGAGRFGSLRVDRGVRSDRWVFSLAPPFFSRAPSVKSPKVMAAAASREGSLRGGSIRSGSTRLPV